MSVGGREIVSGKTLHDYGNIELFNTELDKKITLMAAVICLVSHFPN